MNAYAPIKYWALTPRRLSVCATIFMKYGGNDVQPTPCNPENSGLPASIQSHQPCSKGLMVPGGTAPDQVGGRTEHA